MANWDAILDEIEAKAKAQGQSFGLLGESGEDEIEWKAPFASEHVRAVAWRRNESTTGDNPRGKLLVHFATGGYPRVWLYEQVPYSNFYRLWKQSPSAGRYMYRSVRANYGDGRAIAYD